MRWHKFNDELPPSGEEVVVVDNENTKYLAMYFDLINPQFIYVRELDKDIRKDKIKDFLKLWLELPKTI